MIQHMKIRPIEAAYFENANSKVETENNILRTSDYAMFRFDPYNRPIRYDKLTKLIDAISKKNLLHLFPIVVTRDYKIVDGQHRCKAAEALGVPVYYVLSDTMVVEDAAAINEVTSGWVIQDWLHHWCERGAVEYLRLREFHAAHQWLTLSTAVRLCHLGSVKTTESFRNGMYTADNISFAKLVCDRAMDFKTWVKFWNSKTFLHAITNLSVNPDYDHKRMIQKMQWQSTKLVKCADAESYIGVMDEIYNFKVSEDRRVHLRLRNYGGERYTKQRAE